MVFPEILLWAPFKTLYSHHKKSVSSRVGDQSRSRSVGQSVGQPVGPQQQLQPPASAGFPSLSAGGGAAAASSVDVWHALEPLGHFAVRLVLSLRAVQVQQAVHVVAVLADGVLHAGYVQPADDHAKELRPRVERQGGREGQRDDSSKTRIQSSVEPFNWNWNVSQFPLCQ